MKALGKTYSDAEASGMDFERLPAGGYIVKITAVKDEANKEYLALVYDIAEGEKKGFYADEWGQEHPYAHRLIASYKEKALGMFKGRLKAIDESNGTNFAERAATGFDEQELVGKIVGMVIGYEEYETDRGDVRERSYVKAVCAADRIRRGEFKVPELKTLAPTAPAAPVAGFETIKDEDLPF